MTLHTEMNKPLIQLATQRQQFLTKDLKKIDKKFTNNANNILVGKFNKIYMQLNKGKCRNTYKKVSQLSQGKSSMSCQDILV